MRWMIVATMLVLAGCQTTREPGPQPVEDQVTLPDFGERGIRDIVVAPLRGSAVIATDSLTPPSVEMREVFRRYLINKKNYAVPRSKWVDAHFTPGGTEGLETDAVLDAVIDQWDADALIGRGIVYIGGEFKLISAKDSKVIWSYSCRNVPIMIKQPRVSSNVTETVRAAVREFAVRVLGTVPRT